MLNISLKYFSISIINKPSASWVAHITRDFLRARNMRPKVNSSRFEISLRGKISPRYKVISLLASTWVWANANRRSLRCKFHFGQFDGSEISNELRRILLVNN